LDKDTSGLLLVAKNDDVHLKLQQQFLNKTIKRQYYALVWGTFKQNEGIVSAGISRSRNDPTKMAVSSRGKNAITHYHVLRDYIYMTLLKVQLESGRTHQIRVHMNYIHHPVVGDPTYNGRESQLNNLPINLKKRGIYLLKMLTRQFLHAKMLEFIHPTSLKSMKIEIDLPEELGNILDKIPRWFLQES
jgi:23S rRNA pseudouridine1911/1915/1917 synthase